LGDMQGSLQSYQRELQFAELWSRLSGAGPESRREIALAEEHIGNTLANQGKAVEGLVHLRRAIATYEDLRKIAPSGVGGRRDLALALVNAGDALFQTVRLQEADAAYRNGL